MCDDCGCDKLAGSPDDPAQRARQKTGGWHVHADGTVHRHDHSHAPSHPHVAGRVFRIATAEAVPPPGPVLDERRDEEADGTPGSGKASTR